MKEFLGLPGDISTEARRKRYTVRKSVKFFNQYHYPDSLNYSNYNCNLVTSKDAYININIISV